MMSNTGDHVSGWFYCLLKNGGYDYQNTKINSDIISDNTLYFLQTDLSLLLYKAITQSDSF